MEMCVKRDEEAVVLCSKRLGQGITKKINAAAFTHSTLSLSESEHCFATVTPSVILSESW